MKTMEKKASIYNLSDLSRLREQRNAVGEYKSVLLNSIIHNVNDSLASYKNHIGAERARITAHQLSASQEGENFMNNEALTEKIHSIDNRLSVIESEVKHISSGIARLDNDIKNIDQKLDAAIAKLDTKFDKMDARFEKVDERFEKVFEKLEKFATRDELKNELNEIKDGKRFTLTTWISLGSGVAAVVAAVAAILALN